MRRALVLAVLACLAATARADELPSEAAREQALLQEALAAFNTSARFPLPALADSQVERLAEGKVVKIREVSGSGDEPQRAIGLLRTALPKEALWLSARDVHFTAVDELIEVQLTPDAQWPAVWYQLLDMPRPFSDRHWVVDVTDTHTLASLTAYHICMPHVREAVSRP